MEPHLKDRRRAKRRAVRRLVSGGSRDSRSHQPDSKAGTLMHHQVFISMCNCVYVSVFGSAGSPLLRGL